MENVYNNMDPPVQREFWHIHDPSRLVTGLLNWYKVILFNKLGWCKLEEWRWLESLEKHKRMVTGDIQSSHIHGIYEKLLVVVWRLGISKREMKIGLQVNVYWPTSQVQDFCYDFNSIWFILEWVGEEIPGNDGAYWAASLVSPTRLYYSVASMNDDDVQVRKAMILLTVILMCYSVLDWPMLKENLLCRPGQIQETQ